MHNSDDSLAVKLQFQITNRSFDPNQGDIHFETNQLMTNVINFSLRYQLISDTF